MSIHKRLREVTVRYDEGPGTEIAIFVRASPARTWEAVTDIELAARLSPELQRAEWLGCTGPALGARFVGHNHHPLLGDWRTISHVIEFVSERVFGWAVVDPDGRFDGDDPDPARPMATWRFEVRPEGDGSRLVESVRIGPARSGISLAIDGRPDSEERIIAHRLGELRAGNPRAGRCRTADRPRRSCRSGPLPTAS